MILAIEVAQQPEQQVEGDHRPGVAYMGVVVDRRPADIHRHPRRITGNEVPLGAGHGVVEAQGHDASLYSLGTAESHLETSVASAAAFPTAPDKESLERGTTLAPRFDEDGLIAAVATDAGTGEVLMLAWMNAEALERTLDTGEAHYFSRSRQALWRKGETSGQVQTVEEIRVDCDQDAVWLKVRAGGDGGACHVGYRSCFYRVVENGRLVVRD